MTLLETLNSLKNQQIGLSDWLTIDQPMIDAFAAATGDHQWIHVDRVRAEAGPFAATIAHGYLLLSLLPRLMTGPWQHHPGVLGALNYGLDRVRFITPVRSGSRVRNRGTLTAVEDRGAGRILVSTENTLDLEGEEKPAMVALVLAMIITTPAM
jgi:acyl dehydratase